MLGDLLFVEVDRRDDDVARPGARELDDVLAEVRFEALDVGLGERFVQGDLLGGHRFRLDRKSCSMPTRDG